MAFEYNATGRSSHALIRTSPRGQKFVGRCILCGQEDLTTPFDGICVNQRGLSQDQALLEVLED